MLTPRFGKRLLIAACSLLLIATAALLVLRTTWFQRRVRESIVAAIEHASGGRAEIGSFSYDWTSLTAELKNVVIHGTESASQPPLFQAKSVRIGLRVVGFFKRDIDLALLVVNAPSVHVWIHPDGSTNIPRPNFGGMRELFDLRIEHFELDHGALQLNARRSLVDASSENAHLLLSYDTHRSGYLIRFNSPQIQVGSDRFPRISARARLQAILEQDRLSIERLDLSSGSSEIQSAGIMRDFSRPNLDLNLNARLATVDLARLTNRSELQGGEVSISGKLHYDPSAQLAFTGALSGRKLALRSGRFTLADASLDSNVLASEEHVQLEHLALTAPTGKFTGEAVLNRSKDVEVNGSVAALNVPELMILVSRTPSPWSCRASGRVKLDGTLSQRNWRIQTALRLTPLRGRIPVSGAVDLRYEQRGGIFDFQSSTIHFPNSELSFSGNLNRNVGLTLSSRDLADITPALPFLPGLPKNIPIPVFLSGGTVQFSGSLASPLSAPRVQGQLAMAHFQMRGETVDQFRSVIDLAPDGARFASLALGSGSLHAAGDAQIALSNWLFRQDSPMRLQGQFQGLDLIRSGIQAVASGTLNLTGSLLDPRGSAQVRIENASAYGEHLNEVQMDLAIAGNRVQIHRGRVQAGLAQVLFSGNYTHDPQSWCAGQLEGRIDSNGFPLASLAPIRSFEPGLNARFEVHGEASFHIAPGIIQPGPANGRLIFHGITVDGLSYGDLTLNALTRGQLLDATFSGNLRESRVSGDAQVEMSGQNLAHGEVHLSRISLATLGRLWPYANRKTLPVDGFLEAGVKFEGPVQDPARMQATVQIDQFEAGSPVPNVSNTQSGERDLVLHNTGPITLQVANGLLSVRRLELAGTDTNLKVAGSIGYLQRKAIDLGLDGSVNLWILRLLDPALEVSGRSIIAASVGGTLQSPSMTGTLQIKNAAFQPRNFENGLTAVNGTIAFNQDRATIEKLTAQSGGGNLAFAGFVNISNGHLIYHLTANAENVRLRYASSASITANAQLRLAGTAESSLLSGAVSVSRVVLSPNMDVGNLLASLPTAPAAPLNNKGFLAGLQLDVHLESAPTLQLSSTLSRDIEGDIDLRLRGRATNPVLLGSISASQGNIRVFGTKYSINRCEVDFSNPAKIEPVLDLALQTQTRGISVDITIAGTPGKLNVNYRSDPPLQPRDIISLLTVGRAPGAASSATASNVLTTQLTNPGSSSERGMTSVLGQAISPSSNRLSKLFGVTNIRIDPLVQGITNAAQARLTLEQQISREITVTYVTNLSETAEQIFRVEWAFSSQYSLVALRDDNGEFGIDIQYRKQFK